MHLTSANKSYHDFKLFQNFYKQFHVSASIFVQYKFKVHIATSENSFEFPQLYMTQVIYLLTTQILKVEVRTNLLFIHTVLVNIRVGNLRMSEFRKKFRALRK